ncbi:MAG: ABC transporter ATP-binding protein/permease [Paludibacteraceae bacterium]|nr:ABC transporter ATP-binding protein/permease [Paludibacteraceae bacterium]
MLNFKQKYALSDEGAKSMLIASAANVFYNLALFSPVILLYILIQDIMSDQLEGRLSFYIIGVSIWVIIMAITTVIQYNTCYFSTYRESGVRRITLAEKLRKLPLSFFAKKDSADLTSTLMDDAASIEQASSHFIPQLNGSIISTCLIAVCLFFINWKMALAVVWVLPLSMLIVALSRKVQYKLGKRKSAAAVEMTEKIQECLETVRDLRQNNAQHSYFEDIKKKIHEVEKRMLWSELGTGLFVCNAELLLKFGIATTALVGAMLLRSGELGVLEFLLFLVIASRIYDPLTTSLEHFAAIIALDVNCERLNDILLHKEQTGGEELKVKGGDIEFQDVTFAYEDGKKILDGVSFVAKQGEVTALIGASGSGKTTVSRLAARFWDIDSGKITVGGQDISKVDPEILMNLYSIVFQDVTLFNNTIMENIRIGDKNATDEQVMQAAEWANCTEFIENLPDKWQTIIGENGKKLSGGERQRISIARAFLKNAPIILLDEASASLDVENETLIQQSISKLIKGKTVLVIAHRMRTVAGANKIITIKDGKAIEER